MAGNPSTLRTRLGRLLLPLYRHSLSKLHELRYLFFELTQTCNLNCLHCGSDCTRATGQPRLPAATVLEVLREVRSAYDPHRITVVLSGGEPLCYPGLFQLGHAITELEFPWGMVTNGLAWTSTTVQRARTAGMRSVTISLDGPEEEHNWLRGHPRSFARAVQAIEWLTAQPCWQAMDVITCVHQRNLPRLDETYALLKALGVKNWRLCVISPIGRAPRTPELFLSRAQFLALMQKIIVYRQRGELQVEFSEAGYLGPCYERVVRDQPFLCRAGIDVGGVMATGEILACPNIDRGFSQGNVYRDSFVEKWEKGYRIFRDRTWMKTGACRDCRQWRQCQGDAFHLRTPQKNGPGLCHYHHFALDR